MARRTRKTDDMTQTPTNTATNTTGKGKATKPVKAAPAPTVQAKAAPAPVVHVSTVHVPARGRSYTYPGARGKVTAAVILDALLQTGATVADMAAALTQAMPDNYAHNPKAAVAKAKAHLAFLRKHGAVIAASPDGILSCPDARAVQTMARGGNRA